MDAFIFLGHNITANNDTENEIKRRIQMTWVAFGKFKKILEENQIPMCLKKKKVV